MKVIKKSLKKEKEKNKELLKINVGKLVGKRMAKNMLEESSSEGSDSEESSSDSDSQDNMVGKSCKFVKSNAVVLANDKSIIGIGAGQPSRLDSCKIAANKAQEFVSEKLFNSVAASDAFFPFADGIEILIESGVKAIIQPGGSINDKEVIKAADDAGITMVFTGTRHFKH